MTEIVGKNNNWREALADFDNLFVNVSMDMSDSSIIG
jgi:hypothetical protein